MSEPYVMGKPPGSNRWHIFQADRALCGTWHHCYRLPEQEVIVMAHRCQECVRLYKRAMEVQECLT